MGWQIIKQPNGKYAVWSSIVDAFIIGNCDREDLIEHYLKDAKEEVIKNIDSQLDENNKYRHPLMEESWESCLETIKEVHGEDSGERTFTKELLQEEEDAKV